MFASSTVARAAPVSKFGKNADGVSARKAIARAPMTNRRVQVRYFRLLLSEGGFYGAPIAPATAADIDARLARSVPGVRDRPVWCFRASRARASLVARANPRARAPPIVLDCKSERG